MMRRGDARTLIANAIIALQPAPEDTSVTHFEVGGRDMTAIARLWRPDEVGRCRLCDRCQLAAYPGARLCSLVVDGHVPEERAGMFSEADVATHEARPAWRPIGPLDRPWWRRDRPEAM